MSPNRVGAQRWDGAIRSLESAQVAGWQVAIAFALGGSHLTMASLIEASKRHCDTAEATKAAQRAATEYVKANGGRAYLGRKD